MHNYEIVKVELGSESVSFDEGLRLTPAWVIALLFVFVFSSSILLHY